ncbi:hypothetical protein CR513_26698, partial [Mucuna pruriens]
MFTARAIKSGITRSEKVLQLIHIDICRPITPTAIGGFRYGWVELLHEESKSLDALRTFKASTELKLGIKIICVRFDTGHNIPCLAHRNKMGSCGGNALKTTTYILNHVPSKFVAKTPFELMSGKRLSLKHFHVWGCKEKVRSYNLQMKKLDLKTVNGFFIGYYIGSRGSMFYCPSHITRVIESDRVAYFENEFEYDESSRPHTIAFRDESVVHISLAPSFEEERVFQTYKNMKFLLVGTLVLILFKRLFIVLLVLIAMEDELVSLKKNGVWELVNLLVRGDIDYKDIFSPVTKDSFRIVMVLVAHFNLELHQMDVKIAFLNDDLCRDVYID